MVKLGARNQAETIDGSCLPHLKVGIFVCVCLAFSFNYLLPMKDDYAVPIGKTAAVRVNKELKTTEKQSTIHLLSG